MKIQEFIKIYTTNDASGGRVLSVDASNNDLSAELTTSNPSGGRSIKVNIVAGAVGSLTSAGGGTSLINNPSGVLKSIVAGTNVDFTGSSATELKINVPLTFSTGLTRTTNTITNNLSTGIAGGQTVIGATDDFGLTFKATTGNPTLTNAAFTFNGGNNGATELFKALHNGKFTIRDMVVGRGNNQIASNTGLGVDVLTSVTFGNNLTAVGIGALQYNTSGEWNTGVGAYALNGNSNGSRSTAVGLEAMFQGNNTESVAVGVGALKFGGSQCVGVGYQAGLNNTTGTYNTYVGTGTGLGITTGANNTIIGARVTGLSSSLTGNIILADGAGNQRLNIDSSGNAIFAAAIKTVQPSANGAGVWKLGKNVVAASVIDATQYIEVDIDGSIVKLARIT